VARIAATGAQVRIGLARNGTLLESAMTADALLDSDLQAGGTAAVHFTGGTVFTSQGGEPVRLSPLPVGN